MSLFFTEYNDKKSSFLDFISEPKKIVITTHQNPDGDALGSSLGLKHFLTQLGHKVTVISPTEVPDYLAWLPEAEQVLDYENYGQITQAQELTREADLIGCLDFSSLNRIKNFEPSVRNAKASKAQILLVDHHEQPENFADFVFWNQAAASTTELIFQLIENLGFANLINQKVATCLYTGLVTDTGSFRFDSVSKEVHRIAGELVSHGIEHNKIHRKLFDNNELSRLKMLGYVLNNKLVHMPELGVAYITLTADELQKFESKSGDTEGLVNYGLTIKGVKMAAIFIERQDLIKISFRSVDDLSVSEFSRRYFDGGGHKNAAGGRSSANMEITIEKFLKLLPQYLKEVGV
jgi:bifunctional oligoribonuclease and PAP phosphatase NrnA